MKELFHGVFDVKGKLCTHNLVPGIKVYGERLIEQGKTEYREWDAFRSKLAGAIKKGLKDWPFREGSTVLYLGIAEGTTASHISDIVGEKGVVFGVDISEQTMKKLLKICETRANIVPILGDAAKPEMYKEYLEGFDVDVIYMDVAQKNQTEIIQKNAEMYLEKGKTAMLALKAKSISSTEETTKIFSIAEKELQKMFIIHEGIHLKPFDKDHKFYVLEKK